MMYSNIIKQHKVKLPLQYASFTTIRMFTFNKEVNMDMERRRHFFIWIITVFILLKTCTGKDLNTDECLEKRPNYCYRFPLNAFKSL